MTPIADLIARIVSRVLDKRQPGLLKTPCSLSSSSEQPHAGSEQLASGNDNAEPPANAISFTDLAAAMGEDEDVLLQRLAAILHARENDPPVPDDPELARQADKWAEPEADTPLFDATDATAAWPRDLFEPGRKP